MRATRCASSTRTLIFLALFLISSALCAQEVEAVKSIELHEYEGKSYIFKDNVVLLPGFTVTASENLSFSCVYDNIVNQPPSPGQNFVRTETILIPGITNENSVAALAVEQKSTIYSYIDGIGRTIQTVTKEGSPQQFDLVQPVEFDSYGRRAIDYLPYANRNKSGGYLGNAYWSTKQNDFYDDAEKVAGDDRPFTTRGFDDSPMNQVRTTLGPGDAWYSSQPGESKIVETNVKVDLTSSIQKWTYEGESIAPQPPTVYPPKVLTFSEVKDEHGVVTLEYKDFRGLTVLSVRDANGLNLRTYNIYDVAGRLRLVVPPEASNRVTTSPAPPAEYNNATPQARMEFINRWCFQYVYDDYGRVIKKRAPGMDDWTLMVYDKWDRLVLTREPGWAANQWAFTKYDDLNRPILGGIYSSNATHSQLQEDAMNEADRFEGTANTIIAYTLASSFPTVSEADLYSVTYYDNYDFLGVSKWNAGTAFNFVTESGFSGAGDILSPVKNKTTGSRVKNLTSGNWVRTVTYYDKKYSIVQVIGENHLNGFDRVSSSYDFVGLLIKTKTTHSSSTQASLSILKEMTYDHGGRLLTTYETIDSGQPILTASNEYNELGQQVERNLHSTDAGASFLQSVDFQYNVRGWITNINNSKLEIAGNNDDTNDLFGMDILYHEAPGGGFATSPKFNGNIGAIRWKIENLREGPTERIFGFTYDNVNRLLSTQYGEFNGANWNNNSNMFGENMTYDRNGNIATLTRNLKYGSGSQQVDNLVYRYKDLNDVDKGNRLINVKDATTFTNPSDNNPANGYTEPSTAGDPLLTEYMYDASGRMTSDLNREVTSITYNHLNMPELVQLSGNRLIDYTYDAAGNKLRTVISEGGIPIHQTDYVGSFFYVNNQLSFISADEGRVIKNSIGDFEYEYFLKDHQANTRVVFGSKKETRDYKATMESTLALQEEYNSTSNPDGFQNILPSGRVQLFNHTSKSVLTPAPVDSYETNNKIGGKAVGPAKMLAVSANDRVQIEVFARYVTGVGGNTQLVTGLSSLVTGAYGLSSGEAFTALSNAVPGQAATIPFAGDAPKGYVCYLLFENPNPTTYVLRQFGFSKVTTAGAGVHERLFIDAVMPYTGVVFIFVANESDVSSATSVYFDDLTIIHEKANNALQVVQSSDYLPFGLSFNENCQARAITPPNSGYHQNKFQFQGQERQTGFDLGWYHYKYRMHDPAIGRFGLVDPLAEKYTYNSPFAFSENILINAVELEGLESVFSISMGGGPDGFTQVDNPLLWDESTDPYSYQLAGINQWVTNYVKGYPADLFDKMKEYDMVQLMVDKNQKYLGFRGTHFNSEGSPVSRYSWSEDVGDLSSFYEVLAGKTMENVGPLFESLSKVGSVEMGLELAAGAKGTNISQTFGLMSKSETTMNAFSRTAVRGNVDNVTWKDFFGDNFSAKFIWSFRAKEGTNFTNRLNVQLGIVDFTMNNDRVTIGIGFGKPGYGSAAGFTGRVDITKKSSTWRIGN